MNHQAAKGHMRPTSSSHLKKIKRKDRFTTGTDASGEYFSLAPESNRKAGPPNPRVHAKKPEHIESSQHFM